MTWETQGNNFAVVRRQGATAAINTVLGGKYPECVGELLRLYIGFMREAAAYDPCGTADAAMDDLIYLGYETNDRSSIAQRTVAGVAVELAVKTAGWLVTRRVNEQGREVSREELVLSLACLQGRIEAIAGVQAVVDGGEYPLLPPAVTEDAQMKIKASRAALG